MKSPFKTVYFQGFFVFLVKNEITFHKSYMDEKQIDRGSYMSAHVLLNLLNVLRKRDITEHFISFSQRV